MSTSSTYCQLRKHPKIAPESSTAFCGTESSCCQCNAADFSGAQLDCEPLGVSELDMANVNDMASLHSTGLSERLGLEEEEAVSQLGWPSPVTEGIIRLHLASHRDPTVNISYAGHGLDSLDCGDISLAELDHHLSDAAAFQEPLEEDFQKMLSEWETHIGSLATGGEEESGGGGGGREENSGQCRPQPQPSFRLAPSNTPPRTSPLLSPTTRQLPVSSSGLRSPVLPRSVPLLKYEREVHSFGFGFV